MCVCVYLVKKVDGGLVEVAGEGDLMVADGVKQFILILTTKWRLCVKTGAHTELVLQLPIYK